MTTLTELTDTTAFERLALESTAALRPSETRKLGTVDQRNGTGSQTIYPDSVPSEEAERLRLSLRPLMFGAAWKILDLIVDYVIQAPPFKSTQFSEKIERVNSSNPPPPFDQHPSLWTAIMTTYSGTVELRNNLIHRQAHISATRDLTGVNKNTRQSETLTADQQLAFCRLSQRVVNCTLSGTATERDLFDISFQLKELGPYSGNYSHLLGRDATRLHEIVADIPVRDGLAKVDVPELLKLAHKRFSEPKYIDFIGYIEGNETSVLTGPLEVAEQRIYTFRLTNIPVWLSHETRLTP